MGARHTLAWFGFFFFFEKKKKSLCARVFFFFCGLLVSDERNDVLMLFNDCMYVV